VVARVSFVTTKPPSAGSGLGLATALACARQAHGTIEAVSEPGRGTRFVIHLPAAPAPSAIPRIQV
jgi:signal transduction histidine kinase